MKYWTLMALCKAGSSILTVITLGIPQAIKFLNKKAEEFKAKATGDLEPEETLQHKTGLNLYHKVMK